MTVIMALTASVDRVAMIIVVVDGILLWIVADKVRATLIFKHKTISFRIPKGGGRDDPQRFFLNNF